MHTYGGYRNNLPECTEVAAELVPGFIDIALASIHSFVVVTDFVAEGMYFKNDVLFVALGNGAEIVCSGNTQFVLYTCKSQRVQRAGIHVVAKDDGFCPGVLNEIIKGAKAIITGFYSLQQLFISSDGKVEGHC